jgi:uncharacterized membrane protein YdjX (TVP38/TMEM64 family)
MTESAGGSIPEAPPARGWRRAIVVVLICTSVAMLLSFDAVYDGLSRALAAAGPLIVARPYLGAISFVLLAALSAVLAFFSSALLLPAAVFAWGDTITLVLLWLGWLLGGACTYALGRGLRKPGGAISRGPSQLSYYAGRVSGNDTFALVLLLCLALPSEVPGYLCGYLGVRFRTYLGALALAELPYAAGAVLLGEGAVNRQIGWLVTFGLIGAALSLYALRALHARLERPG